MTDREFLFYILGQLSAGNTVRMSDVEGHLGLGKPEKKRFKCGNCGSVQEDDPTDEEIVHRDVLHFMGLTNTSTGCGLDSALLFVTRDMFKVTCPDCIKYANDGPKKTDVADQLGFAPGVYGKAEPFKFLHYQEAGAAGDIETACGVLLDTVDHVQNWDKVTCSKCLEKKVEGPTTVHYMHPHSTITTACGVVDPLLRTTSKWEETTCNQCLNVRNETFRS